MGRSVRRTWCNSQILALIQCEPSRWRWGFREGEGRFRTGRFPPQPVVPGGFPASPLHRLFQVGSESRRGWNREEPPASRVSPRATPRFVPREVSRLLPWLPARPAVGCRVAPLLGMLPRSSAASLLDANCRGSSPGDRWVRWFGLSGASPSGHRAVTSCRTQPLPGAIARVCPEKAGPLPTSFPASSSMGGEGRGCGLPSCGDLRSPRAVAPEARKITGENLGKNFGQEFWARIPRGQKFWARIRTGSAPRAQLSLIFFAHSEERFFGGFTPFFYHNTCTPKFKSKVPLSWLISGDLRHLLGKNFGREFWARIPRGREFWAKIPPVGKNFGREFWALIPGLTSPAGFNLFLPFSCFRSP